MFQEIILPNGLKIKNRLAKAAMEENMADAEHAPGPKLIQLYKTWADGGAGLLISGNVMIDRRAMTGPGGVVLENDSQLSKFRLWAEAGQRQGAKFFLQINHPGRQSPKDLGQPTLAPSAVALNIGGLSKLFATPREMDEADIVGVIERFVETSKLAELAGFDGVELHAAHGYLLSQFLSPLTNRRTDKWGGSLENRTRFLVTIVREIRRAVRSDFGVAVKLNSADFQRGGFMPDDAKKTIQMLNELGVDFVEISGGSYESPVMTEQGKRDERTLKREAYFLDFAREVVSIAKMPVMVTGGIYRKAIAEEVVASGVALVGMATAIALRPDLPNEWMRRQEVEVKVPSVQWKNKTLASLAAQSVVKYQLRKIGAGQKTVPSVLIVWALIVDQLRAKKLTRAYLKWMAA